MRFFKDFYYITNFKTFFVTFLSICATYICITYEIHADLPLALVSIAIIFPVDRILDMIRTVVNVTGDATVSTIIANGEGLLNYQEHDPSETFDLDSK